MSNRTAGRSAYALISLLLCAAGCSFLVVRNSSEPVPPAPENEFVAATQKETSPDTTEVTAPGECPEGCTCPLCMKGTGPVSEAEVAASKTGEETSSLPPNVLDGSLRAMEGFNAAADAQLGILKDLIAHPNDFKVTRLSSVVAPDFTCQQLRPSGVETVFDDKRLTVQRLPVDYEGSDVENSGVETLVAAARSLTEEFKDAESIQVKFKTFRVTPEGEFATTKAYFHVAGKSAVRVIEQSATWRFQWTVANPPLLNRIDVEDFEQVATSEGQGALFGDSTVAVLGNTMVFREQLLHGIEHWRNQFPPKIDVDFRGHHGLALGDVNGDGLDDVYLCQPKGLPDILLLQNEDGTLTDVSAEAGIQWLDATKSALLIDLDNDGDQDLVVSMKRQVLILSNDGDAKFKLVTTLNGPRRPHSMTAADYDSDGDLDVFVCGFWKFDVYKADPIKAAFALPTPWHDAENGAPNFLYRNDGELNFADVTEKSGLDQNNTRFSHAAGWEDYDNDGDQDLYVANDFGRNSLYRNDDGKFTDVAEEIGVQDQAAGMSVAWSDIDKDGLMDLYVSNMFSSAGNRVTFHSKFQDKLDAEERGEFKRHARGNTLFKNDGSQSFSDVSEDAAVVLGRWAWSSNFVDMNNDGFDDIFVANGFVTNEDTGDL